MKAVIQTGGKQVIVSPGDVVDVELLDAKPEGAVEFGDVRMVIAEGGVQIGKSSVAGAVVKGKVLAEVKGVKTRCVKFRRRADSMTTKGHRQRYHRVEITAINN